MTRQPVPQTLAIALALALASPATAGAVIDILDRPVPFADGRPQLVLYANRESRDSVNEPMGSFTFALRDLNPVVIVRVDLRGIPSIFEGFARSAMRGSFEAGLDRFRRQCVEHGLAVPSNLGDGLYFVADSYGEAHGAAGLEAGFPEALAIAYDGEGRELARGFFPRSAAALEQALRRSQKKPAPPPARKAQAADEADQVAQAMASQLP